MQSVIINKEKRHAFVKMLTRELAIEAKRTMGEYKAGGLALRVSHLIPLPFPPSHVISNKEKHTLTPAPRPAGASASAPETAATTKTARA